MHADGHASHAASLVATPADMARVLLDASAFSAAAYALSQHEVACETGDDERTGFWQDVYDRLVNLRERSAAAPNRLVA